MGASSEGVVIDSVSSHREARSMARMPEYLSYIPASLDTASRNCMADTERPQELLDCRLTRHGPLGLLHIKTAAVCTLAQMQIPCARPFTVRAGDTCDGISAEQGVSSFQLAASNFGVINADCTNIFPGQVICLRRVCLDCNNVHVVAEGDSCTSIANAAQISVGTLVANNPNLGPVCNLLFPGEVVCVANSF
ncbi:hypothetical protein AB1N83_009701 [Pleurotus pulmonarius]